MSDITRDDLTELRESIQEQLRIGFAGTLQRQDDTNAWLKRVNGRTGKAEEAISLLLERSNRQRADFDVHLQAHTHRRADDPPAVATVHERSDEAKPITRRDVYVGVACGLASAGVVIWILEVIGKL